MIYRTWFCLNKHCRHEFTMADKDHPPCPRCGGIRVKWIPKTTGIISGKTRSIDNTSADLQRTYGQKNYASPRMGERMAPRVNPSLVSGQTQRYAAPGMPGWGTEIPINPHTGLMPGSYCDTTGVTAKVVAGVGNRAPVAARSATDTGSIPVYERTGRGKT